MVYKINSLHYNASSLFCSNSWHDSRRCVGGANIVYNYNAVFGVDVGDRRLENFYLSTVGLNGTFDGDTSLIEKSNFAIGWPHFYRFQPNKHTNTKSYVTSLQ